MFSAIAAARIEVDPIGGLIFLACSLTYCYVASTPITVLHAARMIRQPIYSKLARYMWLVVWTGLIGYLFAVVFIGKDKGVTEEALILVLSVPAIWTIFMQMLCVMRLHADSLHGHSEPPSTWVGRIYDFISMRIAAYPERVVDGKLSYGHNRFTDFYFSIARNRASLGARELRESYGHMREHANSVFIVMFEVSLTCLVLVLIGNSGAAWQNRVATVVAVIFLWLLPNVYLWSQANRIERELAGGRVV